MKAVLKTKEAHSYVGSVMIWKELQKHYGDMLVPFRVTPRGDQSWLKEDIDHVLRLAQAEGTLRVV